MLSLLNLKKVPTKCGCDGCYYDRFETCPIVEAANDRPPYRTDEWECVKDDCIFVEVEDERMG